MSSKWDIELLNELEGICKKIGFKPTMDEFSGKKVLVLEYSGDLACEDCNVSIDRLNDEVTAISLLFSVKSGLDKKQSGEIEKLLPYLNKYLSFGAFTVDGEEGYFSYSASFVVREDIEREMILNCVATALSLGLVTTGEAIKITDPIISGEAEASELMNDSSLIFQF